MLLGGLSLYQAMGVAVVLCRARVVGLHETGREDSNRLGRIVSKVKPQVLKFSDQAEDWSRF